MKRVLWCVLVMFTCVTAQAQLFRQQSSNPTEDNLRKFNQFYYYLSTMYVDTLDNTALIEDAIRGVLNDLDPHSTYVTAEEMKSVDENFGGSFSGIGVEFDILNDTLTIINTVSGGPSESLGVLPNDKIVRIDGDDVIGIAKTEVPKRLRGEKGSTVDIEVLRRGVNTPLRFHITRDDIPIFTVDAAYKPDKKTGYIRVNRFADNTMSEFREAIDQMGDLDALILDLRGNGGGLLNQAIEMSEYFLPGGSLVVSTEGRAMPESKVISRNNGKFINGKVVVLIDSSTASGSEIVAGALQDWDRAVVIGQPSFGKGLVQRQVPMSDGSAIRITVARYHTPSGRVIQRSFENGKTTDYYIDHIRRATDKSYRDSVEMNSPRFKTLINSRTVYGGGGIAPDMYIPLDTTKNYSYWGKLVRAGVFNETMNGLLETSRKELERKYPTFEKFDKEFEVDQAIVDTLIANGRKQDIMPTEDGSDDSLENINIYLKALLAQKLWNTTAYYRVINRMDDEEFDEAMRILSNDKIYDDLLKE